MRHISTNPGPEISSVVRAGAGAEGTQIDALPLLRIPLKITSGDGLCRMFLKILQPMESPCQQITVLSLWILGWHSTKRP